MKTETVIQILETLMAECTRRFTPEEKTLKVRTWSHKLKDLTDKQGYAGLDKALDTIGEFMPTIGAFKQLCLSGEGCKSIEDEALNAWALALQVVQRGGAWCSPAFKDSCIAEAIRKMGGWKQLCNELTDNMPFRKKEFVDYYVVSKRQDKVFNPMLNGQCKDYKFVGYEKDENFKKLITELKNAEEVEKSIDQTIRDNVKAISVSNNNQDKRI